MAYKTILCHLFDDSRNAARWNAALGLARGQQAHVVGLFTIPPLIIAGAATLQVAPVVYEQYEAEMQAAADKAGRELMDTARRHGVSAEWRVERGFVNEALRLHALYADLVVMGHAGAGFTPPVGMSSTHQLAADAAILSGRPVLYVPPSGSFDAIGKRILVAWNDSRESARAVADALPLLQQAEAVAVITGRLPSSAPAQDISAVLARHGVTLETQNVAAGDDPTIGALLLREAERRRCDLIVMGIYGRSRMSEWIFGGVSRHILNHAPIPVLFAH